MLKTLSNQNAVGEDLEKKKRDSEIDKRYYQKNKEKINAKQKIFRQKPEYKEYKRKWEKEWRKKNIVKSRERIRKWYKDNPEKARSAKLKSGYGINLDDYNQIFDSQNGLCAICKEKEIRGTYLCVDHNHITGKVRGLLCSKCNSAIGYLNEDIDIFLEAIKYLKKYAE